MGCNVESFPTEEECYAGGRFCEWDPPFCTSNSGLIAGIAIGSTFGLFVFIVIVCIICQRTGLVASGRNSSSVMIGNQQQQNDAVQLSQNSNYANHAGFVGGMNNNNNMMQHQYNQYGQQQQQMYVAGAPTYLAGGNNNNFPPPPPPPPPPGQQHDYNNNNGNAPPPLQFVGFGN